MAYTLIWTKQKLKEEWLALRRQGIDGNDAGAVCGADRWKSPVEVYMDKIEEAVDRPRNEAMELGGKLKDFIARQFSERTGFKTMRRNAILRHFEHTFMLTSMDRWIVGQKSGLLCKNTGEFMKEEWNDAVPARIKLQCMHHMAVTGASHWWVAVLIGGNKLKIERMERDEHEIAGLIEAERHFWENHVQKKVLPAFDGSDGSTTLLKRMYPEGADNQPVRLPSEALELVSLYKQAEDEEKAASAKKNASENRLKAMLGIHQWGIAGPHKIEWKNVMRGNELAYRRFQIK